MQWVHGFSDITCLVLEQVAAYIRFNQAEGDLEMSIRQKIADFVAYRRTIRELSSLSNHQLKDLGILRGEIQDVARGRIL